MSKCRSMYAGSSGAVYNTNAMQPGNGNGKWQGLVSTTNRSSRNISHLRSRAYGDNRNVVFYINQLGGVGGKSKMFASRADGLRLALEESDTEEPIETVIKVSYKIKGKDLNELRQEDQKKIINDVKQKHATELGIPISMITVTLVQGSIEAKVEIISQGSEDDNKTLITNLKDYINTAKGEVLNIVKEVLTSSQTDKQIIELLTIDESYSVVVVTSTDNSPQGGAAEKQKAAEEQKAAADKAAADKEAAYLLYQAINNPTIGNNQANDFFADGPNDSWVKELPLTIVADGAASREPQTLKIIVTRLPEGGAEYRVVESTENGNRNEDVVGILDKGTNTITVERATFDRYVKVQFSSGDIEFSSVVVNGVTLDLKQVKISFSSDSRQYLAKRVEELNDAAAAAAANAAAEAAARAADAEKAAATADTAAAVAANAGNPDAAQAAAVAATTAAATAAEAAEKYDIAQDEALRAWTSALKAHLAAIDAITFTYPPQEVREPAMPPQQQPEEEWLANENISLSKELDTTVNQLNTLLEEGGYFADGTDARDQHMHDVVAAKRELDRLQTSRDDFTQTLENAKRQWQNYTNSVDNAWSARVESLQGWNLSPKNVALADVEKAEAEQRIEILDLTNSYVVLDELQKLQHPPDILATFKRLDQLDILDVGGNTDGSKGFISRHTYQGNRLVQPDAWELIDSSGFQNGQDYRGEQFRIHGEHWISEWKFDIKDPSTAPPLKHVFEYISKNGKLYISTVYVYQINGDFHFTYNKSDIE